MINKFKSICVCERDGDRERGDSMPVSGTALFSVKLQFIARNIVNQDMLLDSGI